MMEIKRDRNRIREMFTKARGRMVNKPKRSFIEGLTVADLSNCILILVFLRERACRVSGRERVIKQLLEGHPSFGFLLAVNPWFLPPDPEMLHAGLWCFLIHLPVFLRSHSRFALEQPAEIMGIIESQSVGYSTYRVGFAQ